MGDTAADKGAGSSIMEGKSDDAGKGVVSEQNALPQGGAPDGKWFEQLPPEMQSDKVFAAFKGKALGDLAKSYVEKEKMIGSSIRLPGEKDTPEEKQAKLNDIHNKLGRPAKPEEYTLEMPELTPAMAWDDGKVSEFKTFAHKLGISNDTANELLKFYADEVNGILPDLDTINRETRQKLVGEVGEPMYKRMVGFAYKAARHYGGEEYIKHLDSSGLGSDEWTIRVLAKAGRDLSEHGVVEPESIGMNGAVTSESAKSKIAEIMNDKEHAYHKRNRGGHEEALEEMSRLHRIAYDNE